MRIILAQHLEQRYDTIIHVFPTDTEPDTAQWLDAWLRRWLDDVGNLGRPVPMQFKEFFYTDGALQNWGTMVYAVDRQSISDARIMR